MRAGRPQWGGDSRLRRPAPACAQGGGSRRYGRSVARCTPLAGAALRPPIASTVGAAVTTRRRHAPVCNAVPSPRPAYLRERGINGALQNGTRATRSVRTRGAEALAAGGRGAGLACPPRSACTGPALRPEGGCLRDLSRRHWCSSGLVVNARRLNVSIGAVRSSTRSRRRVRCNSTAV